MAGTDTVAIDPEQLRALLVETLTAETGPAVVWVDWDGSELQVALSDVQVAVLDVSSRSASRSAATR